jgi:hypothetical protein
MRCMLGCCKLLGAACVYTRSTVDNVVKRKLLLRALSALYVAAAAHAECARGIRTLHA